MLVEQQVRLALEVSDRAYVMRRGEIAMEGASADVRRDAHLVEAHYLDRPADASPASGSPASGSPAEAGPARGAS